MRYNILGALSMALLALGCLGILTVFFGVVEGSEQHMVAGLCAKAIIASILSALALVFDLGEAHSRR